MNIQVALQQVKKLKQIGNFAVDCPLIEEITVGKKVPHQPTFPQLTSSVLDPKIELTAVEIGNAQSKNSDIKNKTILLVDQNDHYYLGYFVDLDKDHSTVRLLQLT